MSINKPPVAVYVGETCSINLKCGHGTRSVTLIAGNQTIYCPDCDCKTDVYICVDNKTGEVFKLTVG